MQLASRHLPPISHLVGLLGWPVEHSLSPVMHNVAFATLGLDWLYLLLPVPPALLGDAVRGLRALGFAGANVTIPHKQTVLAHLDEISPAAQAIGAVNTIVVREGRLYGENTDWRGFLVALRTAGFAPEDQRVLVLGAGGAARAVVYALAQAGAQVSIYNRTASRAAALARDMQHLWPQAEINGVSEGVPLADLDLSRFALLVNATPLGMWPHVSTSPWPEELPLPGHLTVFDLVYNPLETKLLQQARAAGARPIGGLEMLVQQGALAFELWTGMKPPVEVMRQAVVAALPPRSAF